MKSTKGGSDAAEFVPESAASIEGLRHAAAGCRGCHLYENATQTVFGDGALAARVSLSDDS